MRTLSPTSPPGGVTRATSLGPDRMAFDDLKEFHGQTYTGMPVGGQHTWHYTDAKWRETKTTPDEWDFTFESVKRRERRAPLGSGVPPGTQYHWYLLAHQKVRKIDEDSYTTFMSGMKYKVAHKRPHWRWWSCDYPEQESERERVIAILERTLARLRQTSAPPDDPMAETKPCDSGAGLCGTRDSD